MSFDDIEDVLRSIDPANANSAPVNQSQSDLIWRMIAPSLVQERTHRVRRQRVVGAVGASVAASVVLAATLVGAPMSAVASTLNAAARADARSAVLTPIGSRRFYYQQSMISLSCQVATPSMSLTATPITYIANGTIQSWTNAQGAGRVVITPSRIGANGSHFATPRDKRRWEALGKPFIPCALADSANLLGSKPANATGGGSSTTLSGFGGFGFFLTSASQTNLVDAATSINNLPSNSAELTAMLSNGEIDLNGSISDSPQACPYLDGSSGSSLGCTPSEELAVLEQLIQLPDASAKLGSVMYKVLAEMPGATLVGSVDTSNGTVGTEVQVPTGADESFDVVLNASSGALMSCSELLTRHGVTTSIGSVTYGSVQVARNLGVVPGQVTSQ
jgi:hypothetical protein